MHFIEYKQENTVVFLMKKYISLIFLFFSYFILGNKSIYASNVKVTKLDGLVNWSSDDNYIEAKRTLEMAKEIKKEGQRRKELHDAGMSDIEIQKIINNERLVSKNGRINVDVNSKNEILSDNENKKKITKEDDDKITINDYDTYKKSEKENNKIVDAEELTIDLSAIPEPPTIVKKQDVISYDKSCYNEFELARMLQKVGENTNNLQNFSLFAKEVARIANEPIAKQQVISTPKIIKTDNMYLNENQGLMYSADKNSLRHKEKNTNKEKKSGMRNIYAIAKKINKEKNMKKNQKHDYYAVNNESYTEDDVVDSNMISDKQIQAGDVGAPFPIRRDNKNHLRQYQPQNISQVAYNEDNKHLKPIIFEKHVINQVIDNLGSDNAVQITRALINKLGKVDIADDDGNTILMHAVARKNKSLISMLLSEGANPNVLNKDGFAPIHLASSNGDNFAVYSLMMSGANANLVDKNGNTPLMYASKMCSPNSIKIMVALGGNPLLENKFNKKTAFDFAEQNRDSSVISILRTTNKKMYGKRKPVVLDSL